MTLEGNPWFVGADIFRVLFGSAEGHSRRYKCLDDSESLKSHPVEIGLGAGREVMLVSESGLYKLAMRSHTPQARPFQDWVTKEVLPSIRKTGSFVTGQPSLVENQQRPARPPRQHPPGPDTIAPCADAMPYTDPIRESMRRSC